MNYKNTWTKRIPEEKLRAYKTLLDNNHIRNPHVTYFMETGVTEVEFESDLDNDKLKSLLREASK